MADSTRRVVVTGLGATSPLGGDLPSSWTAALEGRSGARPITADWVQQYEMPVTFAAQLAVPTSEALSRVESRRLDPSGQMAPVAQKALDAAGVAAADLDAFIPHQANARIVSAMVKQLQLPESVPVSYDIEQSGNTSAASVPLAMARMLDEGDAPHGGLALLIGFGAGLTYAAQVVRLP